MRRFLSLFTTVLLVFVSLFSAGTASAAGKNSDFSVEVTCNCWSKYTSVGGSSLYTPYLKLNVTNRQSSSVSRVVVKVVFYNEAEKSMWSDETDYLVSGSDDPLKSGYSKTAFVRSSVGYRSQPSANSLPEITADVYINDDYYGSIDVKRSFSETTVSQQLTASSASGPSDQAVFDTDDPFGVTVTAAYWNASTGFTGKTLYVPYLKIQVTNQQASPATKINVKVVFIDENEKSVWDDESSYLVSSGDTPLKTGYNKTAYISAGVGYTGKLSTDRLPDITAEVYINDESYGRISISKSYYEDTLNTVLKKSDAASTESTVKVDTEVPYLVTVVANYWTASKGAFGGQTLYVPYLKLNVLNQSGDPLKRATVKAVFYNEREKTLWSDESEYLVSSGDSPVQHGYSKTAFIESSVGYSSKPSESNLPQLTAEIYLNDEYIGTVNVSNTYTAQTISEPVTKAVPGAEASEPAGDEPFDVYIITNCWAANVGMTTLYTPYLKLKVLNRQGIPADKINVQVVFFDEAEKTVWSDETSYLVSGSDTPLKNGYGKVAYIRSSVGYRSKPSASSLPHVTAEIYINGELYGTADVKNTYSETVISEKLDRSTANTAEDSGVINPDSRDYEISYLSNCWTSSTGLNGRTLYVPYLKINVTNCQSSSADRVVVHVIFTQESDKEVWSDETEYLVTGSDAALRTGYSKTAFVKSSVGYVSKVSTSDLPVITAEIYINDTLYDTVTINNQYGD